MVVKNLLVSKKIKSIIMNTFTYSTVRSATIKSTNIGIIYRTLQIALLVYIIGYRFEKNCYSCLNFSFKLNY